MGEPVQGGFVNKRPAQEGVAGAQSAGVALQDGQVRGMGVGQQQIHETPAQAGGALDQLQVLRAKDHRPHHSQVIPQLPHRLGVEGQFALGGRPVNLDLVARLRRDGGADEITFLAVADHLRAADAAKRAQGGQQINGFEKVGLALGIVAEQQVKAGRKIGVQPRVIAEVAKPQMQQMHSPGSLKFRRRSGKVFEGRPSPNPDISQFGRAKLPLRPDIWAARQRRPTDKMDRDFAAL